MWRQWIQRILVDDRLLFEIALAGQVALLMYVSGVPIATILLNAVAPASVSDISVQNGPTRRKMNRFGTAGGFSLAVHGWARKFGLAWIFALATTIDYGMIEDRIFLG